MNCKFCGRDIGKKTSCPICNNKKRTLATEENALEEQALLNEDESSQKNKKQQGTELAEKIYNKTNALNPVGAFFNIVPAIAGFLIPLLLMLIDKIPRGADRIGDIIIMSKIMVLGFLVGILAKESYGLLEKMLLRSMMKTGNPPLDVLIKKLIVNGKTKNIHWVCMKVHPDNKNNKYTFVESIVYIIAALICGVLSYFYFSDISQRYEAVGSLPEAGKLWFFVTPLAILTAVILVAYAIAKIISQSKTTIIDKTKIN